jgi:hypothetical protein
LGMSPSFVPLPSSMTNSFFVGESTVYTATVSLRTRFPVASMARECAED